MNAPTLPSEQLRWNVLEHAHNPTDVAFEALPPETLALFEPRGAAAGGAAAVRWPEGEQLPPGHEAIGGPYQQGPMPRFAGDASEICTAPEWREYWSRQGVLDAVCDTAQTMADTMRRLRVPLGQGRAALDVRLGPPGGREHARAALGVHERVRGGRGEGFLVPRGA